jgi:hypothetical protein
MNDRTEVVSWSLVFSVMDERGCIDGGPSKFGFLFSNTEGSIFVTKLQEDSVNKNKIIQTKEKEKPVLLIRSQSSQTASTRGFSEQNWMA